MPLSKARNRERMRRLRSVQPSVIGVLEGVQPAREGYYPAWAITSWCQFNGRVRQMQLPNGLDGRYRCLNGVWLVI